LILAVLLFLELLYLFFLRECHDGFTDFVLNHAPQLIDLGYSANLLPTRKGNDKEKCNQNSVPKIQIEKVILFRDQKCETLQGFAPPLWHPGCDGVYNQGSGISVLQMNRMCPRPKKEAGLAQGGRFNKTRN
jgi:hypothetical protein